MMIKLQDLFKQYQGIQPEIDSAIKAVIADCAFIGGKYATEFEQAFAQYQEVRHCVGVGNGTDALEIVLEAMRLPPKSEVLVPANSFIATAEAVTRAGLRVVFCDCDTKFYGLCPRDLAKKITGRTAAVIVVHLYGHPSDMDTVLPIAREHHLKVIEDCAQAHGSLFKGRKLGGLGDAGTFSFYPGKNLGAYGDAGAVVTQDADLARHCRMIANHGRVDKYDHQFEGRNSRLDGLQAAVLRVKLNHLDAWITRKRQIADCYLKQIRPVEDLVLPQEAAWAKHSWHQFVVRTKKRDQLKEHLRAAGIESGIHYPIALPRLKAYQYCGQAEEDMAANRMDRELLSLPAGEHLTDAEVSAVISAVNNFFK